METTQRETKQNVSLSFSLTTEITKVGCVPRHYGVTCNPIEITTGNRGGKGRGTGGGVSGSLGG